MDTEWLLLAVREADDAVKEEPDIPPTGAEKVLETRRSAHKQDERESIVDRDVVETKVVGEFL